MLLGILLASFSLTSEKGHNLFSLKEKLSEYGFFTAELKQLLPARNVIPYDLNSTLFSNYAEKQRFVFMPEGSQVAYKEKGVLYFPQGTYLIKNFYYPYDFRHAEKGRRIIETRLLVHTSAGWEAWPYYWNEEQTEAYYNVAGEATEVNYISENGKRIKVPYYVPNKNECKGCHSFNQQMQLIGPSVEDLNRVMKYADGPKNQLVYRREKNMLVKLADKGTVPKMPEWNEEQTGTLNARARAYPDINCAH